MNYTRPKVTGTVLPPSCDGLQFYTKDRDTVSRNRDVVNIKDLLRVFWIPNNWTLFEGHRSLQ